MPNAYKLLGNQQVAAASTDTTVYTVPASTQTIIKHIRVVNNDTVDPNWFKLWHDTDGGGVSSDPEVIVPQANIPAGGWAEFEGTLIFEENDNLVIQVESANEVTIFVYGLEIS